MKKKKSKSRFLFYIIAISCLVVFALILLSSILDMGEKLRNVSIYLEIGFYVLVALIVIIGIIWPIIAIVKSPSLSIVTSVDDRSSEAIRAYKKVAKVIVKNNDLPEEETLMLVNYKNPEELLFNINYVFEHCIKKQLNGIIISNAKTVMVSTAICQNGRFDMLTVFAVNLRMIKQLVERCGFRPSMANLSKLTINVFSTALIADGLENLKLEDIIPKSAMNAMGEIPMLGKVVESMLDGAANALLTIRIGCVCRRYLYSDGAFVTKDSIRSGAYKEALLIIPQVIADTLAFFPRKIVRFFSSNKEKEVKADAK